MSESRRKFDPEFRDGAVRLVLDTGKSVAEVARDLGINPGALGNWVTKDREQHDAVNGIPEDSAAEVKRLRAELAAVQMERDVLERSVLAWVKGRRNERGPHHSPTRGPAMVCHTRSAAPCWNMPATT
ncbi:transposase [Sciscionella marina]|uniref:transposase n=1 Tax=Sciscionella marina TaxID=508770 RepID=UPI003B83395D